MEEGFSLWANPSSPHGEGRRAKNALEDARARIKAACKWDGEVIFTSGASESLWLALNKAQATRRIVSAVEHDAVFRAAPDAEIISVHPWDHEEFDGEVDLDRVPSLSDAVVAVQQTNSETGTAPNGPLVKSPLVERTRAAGGVFLQDCSQSLGYIPDCDMAVISAHKFGGPIGVGALLVRDFNLLEPMGGHERGYRQGTENLPAVMGMAAALELCDVDKHWMLSPEQQFDFANDLFKISDQLRIGTKSAHILAITHPTMSAQALLIRLDAMGIAVSAGSACSSGTLKKSRVLDAFGVSDEVAARTIRVSLGWNTTTAELDRFLEAWRSLT